MFLKRKDDTMKNRKNVTKAHEDEWDIDEIEVPDEGSLDRTLVLRREPVPRKTHLMAAGVKDIRCICCGQIRPIAGAGDLGEGWICEDCLSDTAERRKAV